MTTVFTNATVIQTSPPVDVIRGVDVVVEGSLIKAVGKNAASSVKADKVIDLKGKLLMPGFVCSHHHYYSGLSRGMLIIAGPQTDFIQVLKEWWWRLDRGLDEESCYYSSLICSIDAIASGTTSVVDHHASPSFIDGSLDVIAKGMEEVGIRGTTCYEVTDRNFGLKEVKAGVDENIRFAKACDAKGGLVGAMIGGHAPFTIPDEGLDMMSEACRSTGKGMHLHVAEDKYDAVYSHHFHGKDIVDRLDEHHLLGEKTLLVHGLHLNEHEIELLNERGCFFAHNARSNMNNHVGYCRGLREVKKLVLGTDGCGGNMLEEIKLAFFKHKDEGLPWWPADFVSALSRGNELLQFSFPGTRLGRVEPGYKADLVVMDYRSPTPLARENLCSHIVWGMSSNAVESVMVDGRLVMESRSFPGLDVNAIYAKASEVAKALWKKVDRIAP